MILNELAPFDQDEFNSLLEKRGWPMQKKRNEELFKTVKVMLSAGMTVSICKRIFKP